MGGKLGRAADEAGERFRVEDETHQSAPSPCVVKLEAAEMFLDDLLDDGEAEPSALDPGGDVGLGQPAALGGQAHAAVLDLDGHPPLVGQDADADRVRLLT